MDTYLSCYNELNKYENTIPENMIDSLYKKYESIINITIGYYNRITFADKLEALKQLYIYCSSKI